MLLNRDRWVDPVQDGIDQERVARHPLHGEHEERAHVEPLALPIRLDLLHADNELGVALSEGLITLHKFQINTVKSSLQMPECPVLVDLVGAVLHVGIEMVLEVVAEDVTHVGEDQALVEPAF